MVEPHPTLRTVLVQRLRQDGLLTATVASAGEALEVCQEQTPDLLVSAEGNHHRASAGLPLQPRQPASQLSQVNSFHAETEILGSGPINAEPKQP